MAFTFFFRDLQTLNFASDHLVQFASGKSDIKIWNPGCASGQEPYSFAMILAEKMGRFAFKNVKFHTTDIDISNLFGKIISDGIYPYEQLQRIPKELLDKYFNPFDDKNYQIDYLFRSKMNYKIHDLTSLQPIDKGYCMVICKNVLLHLSPAQRIDVIRMFSNVLLPGGFLVMENTQKLPAEVSGLFSKIADNSELYYKI